MTHAFTIFFLFFASLWPEPRRAYFNCMPPSAVVEFILSEHPDAIGHPMTDEQFGRFSKAVRLSSGDHAIWFERPGVDQVYVVVFRRGCEKGSGVMSPEGLRLSIMGPET